MVKVGVGTGKMLGHTSSPLHLHRIRLNVSHCRSTMTPSNKKPGVAFWATVVVVVLVICYPLSIGPTTRLYWITLDQPAWLKAIGDPLYAPMHWTYAHGPDWYRRVMEWYCGWWYNF
jgi:hypothetical protein